MPSFFPVEAIRIEAINLKHGEKIEIVLPDDRIMHVSSTGSTSIFDNGRFLMSFNPYGIAKLMVQSGED